MKIPLTQTKNTLFANLASLHEELERIAARAKEKNKPTNTQAPKVEGPTIVIRGK